MSSFFEKIKTGVRPAEKSAAPRLTLAAFGKHPGWDDHLPGIGVETDALAYAKQTLYVSGIGKQIDSGAWEKLEPGKRLEGFDHAFLWLRPGHILLGELWSSVDGKGRAKYPMVLCVDSEGIAPAFLLAKVQPDLERLRAACKAAVTADQVIAECRTSQEQVRTHLNQGDLRALESGPTIEARKQFLENREFMPDRLGLMRVLHELAGSGGRSRHLRVPLASDSHAGAMLLWSEFFKLVVLPPTAVLLISHRGADWLDVLIGEPDGPDFFCLQAALKAVPLTTEIPYELPPEMKPRWDELEARFLGRVAPVANEAVRATSPSGGGAQKSERPAADSPAGRKWMMPVIAGAVLLAGVSGFLLFKGGGATTAKTPEPTRAVAARPAAEIVPPVVEPKPKTNVAVAVANPVKPVPAAPVVPVIPPRYEAAMTEARAALGKQNFAEAIARADEVLGIKPDDQGAAALKRDAAARQQELAAQTRQQQQYAQAIAAGQSAFGKNDFTGAIAQADLALALKANDPVAAKLRADAKSQVDLAAIAAADRQAKYDTAMKAAGAALAAKDFAETIKQADAALANLSGDAAATKLKGDAQNGQAEIVAQAEREKNYQAALATGQQAYDVKKFAEAIQQAGVALAIKPGDAAATKVKSEATARLDEIAAQAAREKTYAGAMWAGQSAYNRKEFAEALKQLDAALRVKPEDAAATGLKKKAAEDKDLQEVQASIASGNLDKARSLCAAHVGIPAFEELAKQLKAKESDTLDRDLEIYQVCFGLLDRKKAITPEAKREQQLLGEFPNESKDEWKHKVQVLQEAFNATGRLNAALQKKLDDLKKAVDQHL